MDYTTVNHLYIARGGGQYPARYTWPRGIVHAVAEIVKQRRVSSHRGGHADSARRQALLRRVNQMEDAFVETACKTLI